MERKDWEKIIIKTIVSLTIAILIILHFDLAIKGISALVGFMSPIILGFVVAFVINVILIRLEKIYFPHTNNRFLKKKPSAGLYCTGTSDHTGSHCICHCNGYSGVD